MADFTTKKMLWFSPIVVLALGSSFFSLKQKSQKDERIESESSPRNSHNPITCKENERIQLMDSEKCYWACSTYLTAPTETRCRACKGIVVKGSCPLCPPLCTPSMWLLENENSGKTKTPP